jgi:hypothetical protein
MKSILHPGERAQLQRLFEHTEAASELPPLLPAGDYVARIVHGGYFRDWNGLLGYKLILEVDEPSQYTGRLFWHALGFTPKAMPFTKRDLAKIRITSLEQLDKPLPPGIRCRAQLAVRRGNTAANRVKSFEVA